jgi:hemoglobin/transferrin/lactoferrin receptor protein
MQLIKKIFFLSTISFQLIFSQEVKDSTSTKIEEIKISNKLIVINKQQSSSQINLISKKEIEFQNFQNTADLLGNSGSLFVQKSQQGGGSPVLRGFESSRVLLLVDGIRLNNLIFRSGHLQNVITVDENFLESVIVQYGPTSTLYGSDALGGSVNMITKRPKSIHGFTGNVNTRYSTVNKEKSRYFDLNYSSINFATLTAFSYNDFGSLTMGKRKNPNGDFFGERNNYVETRYIDGQYKDFLVSNPNPYEQVESGYKQYNFMQKFVYQSKKGAYHHFNVQYSTSSDINRYDRLTDKTSTGLRSAEWYYGPQKRLLANYTIEKENVFKNTSLRFDLAYQNIEESRINRNFNNYNLQTRVEKVQVISTGLNYETKLKKANIYYGLETYLEKLNSTAIRRNINTNIESPLDTRYPNGDNKMNRSDVYFSYTSKNNTKTNFNGGLRLGYTQLKSSIADNTLTNFPFTDINQNNFTYSANVGIVHNASEYAIVKSNLSSGFRVPNIDDLAKIFETGNGNIIVPNENLKPEKTITADLGFIIKDKKNKNNIELTYFYTKLIDAIVTDNFTFNNASTLFYDNGLKNVIANQNKGKAFVTGFSVETKSNFAKNLVLNASYNITLGRVINDDQSKTPLDHIPPSFGKVGITYNPQIATFEIYLLYNGQKQLSDYSNSGEDNLVYAPSTGIPAWETYNFKASTKSFKGFTLFAGIENILDIQYRNFASGINAGGRNIYSGMKFTF